ncbi:autotransporter outer membrane beta-barrel domain-containing protein [Pollutimonas thiosulfatoxidans]|uniref:Autotransporter domain-containing protein n=1 Tax=Pollutimonas thiosulfatoxidans TaxID=2028345 RepID=A0A410G926_9BURK|nr:autotransporter outer membrane beta-barrel domain-containing protein [Pollutimonas thiosulfatoxidans]QAA92800.1 hypothetical protein CKA81_02280 [Pollutimonas thiosulfatoxidans]
MLYMRGLTRHRLPYGSYRIPAPLTVVPQPPGLLGVSAYGLPAFAQTSPSCGATSGAYVKADPDPCSLDDGSDFDSVIVQEGAVQVAPSTSVGSGSFTVSDVGAVGAGMVSVDGNGAILDIRNELVIGSHQDGVLSIDAGALLRSGSAVVGKGAVSAAVAAINGAESRWLNRGTLEVGQYGVGTVNIMEGQLFTGSLSIGATGTVIVGKGGGLDSTRGIHVGADGQLNIGGLLGASLPAGTVSAPYIQLDGDAQLWFNHTDIQYVFGVPIQGDGVVTLTSGTTIFTADSHFAGTTIVASGATLQLGNGGNAGWISGEVASDGTVVFDRSDDITLTNPNFISTTVIKNGRGAVRIPESSLVIMLDTQINEGRMIVNGELLGDATVNSGGTLSGIGTVTSARINAGGTLAPGDPIGTINICCTIDFEPGAFLDIDVDTRSGLADQVTVVGPANLNGTVRLLLHGNGNLYMGHHVILLSEDDVISGQFQALDSPYIFLNTSLDYTSQEVFLNIARNARPFSAVARTPNQRSVAGALASLPDSSPLYQSMLRLTDEQLAPQLLNSLSGEVHASSQSALFASSQYASTLPLRHLRSNLNAGWMPGGLLASAGPHMPAGAMPQHASLPLWADVVANRQTRHGNDNVGSTVQTTSGVFVGGDVPVGANWRLGGAVGYTHSRSHVDDRGNASATSDAASVALYAGRNFKSAAGTLQTLLGAAYTTAQVSTTRHASVHGDTQRLRADYRASAMQTFGELGFAMPAGSGTLAPFAGLSATWLRTPAFSESGGTAALHSSGSRSSIVSTTLGLRGALPLRLNQTEAQLHGSVAWRHSTGDLTPTTSLAFSQGDSFAVRGIPVARNAALVSAGLSMRLSRHAALNLAYEGDLASGAAEHGGRVSLSWRF